MAYKKQTKVELNNECFKISTIYDELFDRYETMIFKCDQFGDIADWSEIYIDYYLTEEEAEEGHKDCVKNIKEKLNMGTANIYKQMLIKEN